VVIGNGVKTIPESAFSNCTNLTKVTLGEKVEILDDYAFANCTSLTDINLNDYITTFKNRVFQYCTSLTKVIIGSSVLSMGTDVFLNCSNIKTVEIHDGAVVIGNYAFDGCTKLQSVNIPNSILNIGKVAFGYCSSLISVKIGNGAIKLAESVFNGCVRLQAVTIGSGVQKLDYGAFANDTQIKSLTVLNPQPPAVEKEVFSNYNATLYVPAQSVDLYAAHEKWKNFAKIDAIEEQVYLTIRQAEQGCVRQAMNIGESYQLTVVPDEGWKINSVMFNDEDVTGMLVDNTYTTPAITADAVLSVVFESADNKVRVGTNSRLKVTGNSNGRICINNITPGDVVTVYSANGMITHRQTANGSEMILNVDKHGVYLVTIGSSTFKLSI
jgi:hypothetical protein